MSISNIFPFKPAPKNFTPSTPHQYINPQKQDHAYLLQTSAPDVKKFSKTATTKKGANKMFLYGEEIIPLAQNVKMQIRHSLWGPNLGVVRDVPTMIDEVATLDERCCYISEFTWDKVLKKDKWVKNCIFKVEKANADDKSSNKEYLDKLTGKT